MNSALLHEPLTRSVEDYLKTIYRLSQKGQPATTNDIAHQLEPFRSFGQRDDQASL
jgi:Mn-dependent transcriptional regulator